MKSVFLQMKNSNKSDNMNFFSDPKVLISILALVISLLSFIWTLGNQNEQNRRWSELNKPNIVVTEMTMQAFKIVSKEDLKNIVWGYQPIVFNTTNEDFYQLPYYLSIRTSKDEKKIENSSKYFTFGEIESDLLSKGYKKGQIGVNTYFNLHPVFKLKNIGKIDANNFEFKTFVKTNNKQDWFTATESDSKFDFSNEQVFSIILHVEYPTFQKFPQFLSFKLIFSYNDNLGQKFNKEIILTWYPNDNTWSSGLYSQPKEPKLYKHNIE